MYIYTGSGNEWESVKVEPAGAPEDARFGSSVLLHNNMLFVGSPWRDGALGAVSVYERSGDEWRFIVEITPENTENTEDEDITKSRDLFGTALTLRNNMLAVGAPGSVVDREKIGAVYIYNVSGRDVVFREKVAPKGGKSGERFGSSISSDELSLVIGAVGDDSHRLNSGAVYIVGGSVGSCEEEDGEEKEKSKTPIEQSGDQNLAKRKVSWKELLGVYRLSFLYCRRGSRMCRDEITRREERIVIFDEKTVSAEAQQRAAELRGVTAPALPGEVVVKKIVLGDTPPKEKETVRSRDTVIEETRKEAGVVVPTGTRDLKVGDKGEEVYRLQVFLNENGYIIARSGPGSSGNEVSTFGVATERALKSFQLVNGIPVTGVLDEATRNIILTYVVDF